MSIKTLSTLGTLISFHVVLLFFFPFCKTKFCIYIFLFRILFFCCCCLRSVVQCPLWMNVALHADTVLNSSPSSLPKLLARHYGLIVSLHLHCQSHEQRSCFVLQCRFSASVNPFARAQTPTLCSFNLGYRCQDNNWQDGHQNERGLHHVGKRLGFSSCSVWNWRLKRCEGYKARGQIYPLSTAVAVLLCFYFLFPSVIYFSWLSQADVYLAAHFRKNFLDVIVYARRTTTTSIATATTFRYNFFVFQ